MGGDLGAGAEGEGAEELGGGGCFVVVVWKEIGAGRPFYSGNADMIGLQKSNLLFISILTPLPCDGCACSVHVVACRTQES